MKLSVLTTTKNCARTIRGTIESVASLAPYIETEHLILDAGSTDGTCEILQAAGMRHPHIQLLSPRPCTIPEAWNTLLRAASGSFVLILNGDDALIPDSVKRCFPVHYKEDLVCCGAVEVQSMDGRPIGMRGCRPEDLDRYMSVNHPAMIVPRELFTIVGGFDTANQYSFDYEWVWRAQQKGVVFETKEVVIAIVRLGGFSARVASKASREIYRFQSKPGTRWLALRGLMWRTFNAMLRRVLPHPLVARLRRARRFQTVDSYLLERNGPRGDES